jgi:hypothetical protein
MNHRFLTGSAAIALAIGLAVAAPARADDATPAPPAPPPHPMVGPVMFSGWVDGGTSINPDDPDNHVNFGQLFSDQANTFRMNQLVLTAEKDLDPAATGLDWGFKIQGLYGTDARFTHSFGLFDRATNSPYQFDFIEANALAHLPVVFSGGIDLKAGIYSTPIGYEVIDAPGNFFYTHNYITNFGIPLKHFGLLSTSHVNDLIDIWAGVDTGNQGSFPKRGSVADTSASILGGFGVNNPIPNLTILALAHLGPANGYVQGDKCSNPGLLCYTNGAGQRQDPNHHARQIYDVVTTYKWGDNWTFANEINAIKDDLSPALTPGHSGATAEGTSVYAIYKLNDQWSFGARGEVFRDDQGFFVSAVQESDAFVNAERFIPTTYPAFNSAYNAGKATYGDITIGANYVPPIPPLPLNASLTIRPEIRWDHAWGMNSGAHPFDVTAASGKTVPPSGTLNGTKDDQFLFSVDAIFGF